MPAQNPALPESPLRYRLCPGLHRARASMAAVLRGGTRPRRLSVGIVPVIAAGSAMNSPVPGAAQTERNPNGWCAFLRPCGVKRLPGPVLADTADVSSPRPLGRRGHPSLRHGHHFLGNDWEDRSFPGRRRTRSGVLGKGRRCCYSVLWFSSACHRGPGPLLAAPGARCCWVGPSFTPLHPR